MQILTAANKHTQGLVPFLFKSTEKRKAIAVPSSSSSSFSIYRSFSIAAPLAEVVFLGRIVGEWRGRQAKANFTD